MNNIKIIRILLIGLMACFFTSTAFSQEKIEEKLDKPDKPVRKTFISTQLIDNQTTLNPSKGAMELMIQHRFGIVGNGISDLYGIYSSSNIRMAFQYGITDDLAVGFGTEKDGKLQDFFAKYSVLKQTKSDRMPVSVSVYANASIDGRDKEFFGDTYRFSNRVSYFTQVIVARKISKRISWQVAPGFAHINAVDKVDSQNKIDTNEKEFQHDKLTLMTGGKIQLTKKMAFMAEYHHAFAVTDTHFWQEDIEPGIAFGLEIGTSTHAFQIFASNFDKLNPEHNYIMNTNKFDSDGIHIGFNIRVQF